MNFQAIDAGAIPPGALIQQGVHMRGNRTHFAAGLAVVLGMSCFTGLQAQTAQTRAKVPVTIAKVRRSNYMLPVIASPFAGCTEDTWTPTSLTNAPTARAGHTAVWTGSEMIVWGGGASGPSYFKTGGRYNPSTDSWTATNATDAPDARGGHGSGPVDQRRGQAGRAITHTVAQGQAVW